MGSLDLLKLGWRHVLFEEDEISVVEFLELEVLFLMGVHECNDGLKVELRDGVQLDKPLGLPVNHDHKHVQTANRGYLYAFFQAASFPLKIRNSSVLGLELCFSFIFFGHYKSIVIKYVLAFLL